MTAPTGFLVDTNVLLRALDPSSSASQTAQAAVLRLLRSGKGYLVPQIVYEFWVVATRPKAANGLGFDVFGARNALQHLALDFVVLDDVPAVYRQWEWLVFQHGILGKQAHDARIAAAMLVHGVRTILTFDSAVFARFPEIEVLDPAAV